MKLDTHVHTFHSGHSTIWPLAPRHARVVQHARGRLSRGQGARHGSGRDHRPRRDQRRARRSPIGRTSSSAAKSPVSSPTTACKVHLGVLGLDRSAASRDPAAAPRRARAAAATCDRRSCSPRSITWRRGSTGRSPRRTSRR